MRGDPALPVSQPWPHGCRKPAGCERRRQCGYIGCPHEHTDIAADVDAAVAAAEANRTGTDLRVEAILTSLFGPDEGTRDIVYTLHGKRARLRVRVRDALAAADAVDPIRVIAPFLRRLNAADKQRKA